MTMLEDDEFQDSVERDGGVFVGRRAHIDDPDDDEGRDQIPDEDHDPELWAKQLPLIEEDVADGLRLADFPEEAIPRIIDAMGDDVAEPLQDSPNGTSATGSPFEPEHGGFPER